MAVSDKRWTIHQADCLEFARSLPDNSFDLTFGSPPYEAARTYGIDFKLRGQEWVDWMVERMVEFVRVTNGLVAMVLEGQTRQYRWSAVPALLMADLHRRGVHLRKPPIFHRVGVPGGGGTSDQHKENGGSADWLRNDYEFILCCTKGGKLPWADTLAMGHAPKYAVGGAMSNRHADGKRANQARQDGMRNGKKMHEGYTQVAIANPGNVIRCAVGRGHMDNVKMVHENEAPFPIRLPLFFVRSFCPPGGSVYDPFSGSGTTAKAAIQTGRRFVGTDIRESQVQLTTRRLSSVQQDMF